MAVTLIHIPDNQRAIAQSSIEPQAASAIINQNEIKRPRFVSTETRVQPIETIENTIENVSDLSANNSETSVAVKESPAIPYTATAYCLNGRTASGAGVRRGIIAADPRVLPLGTKVQLSAGTWSGTYTVADTGGKIKGKKIDVWVPNSTEARRFGRRTVHIKVLGRK